MDEIKQDFPYHVGFGLCNNDFTISEMSLAAFKSLEDAKAYVTFKNYNFVLHEKIYYIDEHDTQSMQTVRYIYDAYKNEFIEGNELVSSKKDIYIAGYEVSAIYNDEDGEFDYKDSNVCMFKKDVDIRMNEHYRYGAAEVNYYEKEDIGIKEYFWGADKFLQGNADNDKGTRNREYDDTERER